MWLWFGKAVGRPSPHSRVTNTDTNYRISLATQLASGERASSLRGSSCRLMMMMLWHDAERCVTSTPALFFGRRQRACVMNCAPGTQQCFSLEGVRSVPASFVLLALQRKSFGEESGAQRSGTRCLVWRSRTVVVEILTHARVVVLHTHDSVVLCSRGWGRRTCDLAS